MGDRAAGAGSDAALPAPPRSSRPTVFASPFTGGELLLLVAVVLLPTAVMPTAYSPFWAAKTAVLLPVGAAGLVALVGLCARRDRAAWAAAAFLTVATVATALSPAPLASLVGIHGAGNGLWFLLACGGAWALGRSASPAVARALPGVLLAGVSVSSAVAWLSMSVNLHIDALTPLGGMRAIGLEGNPVFYGALAAGAMVLAARYVRTARTPWMPALLLALSAGGAQLSGSRIALLAGAVGVAGEMALALLRREARAPAGREPGARPGTGGVVAATVMGAAAVAGVLLALLPPGTGATARSGAGEVSADLGVKLDIWRMGGHAFMPHPVLGVGPGRFRAATIARTTLRVARVLGPTHLVSDGHNFVFEVLVTTGLLGLAAAVAWMVFAWRGARGPLVGFVLVVAASWFLQPADMSTTPLLLLALGAATVSASVETGASAAPPADAPSTVSAAAARTPSRRPWPRAVVVVAAIAAVLGGAAGVGVLYGEQKLADASNYGSSSALRTARHFLGFYPIADEFGREIAIRNSIGAGPHSPRVAAALAAARATVRADPTRPDYVTRLGQVQEAYVSKDGAEATYRHALAVDPWYAPAMVSLSDLEASRGNLPGALRWRAQSCRVSSVWCGPVSALRRLAESSG